jgi:hypothetical protein
VPQGCNTADQDQAQVGDRTGSGMCTGRVIMGDRIVTAGAGIDAVMDHVNVTVITN